MDCKRYDGCIICVLFQSVGSYKHKLSRKESLVILNWGINCTIAIKLSIFYTIPIFEVMKNNLSFGFYSTCTLVFWLPNLDKFD